MKYTKNTHISYEGGLKYRLVEPVFYPLHYDYGIKEPFKHPQGFYEFHQDDTGNWWIIGHVGCAWDGPTGYFDFKFTMHPSFVHDILHWGIGWGVVAEKYNFLIDRELEHALRTGHTKIPWWMGGNITRNLRAKMFRIATGTVDEIFNPGKKTDRKVTRHKI